MMSLEEVLRIHEVLIHEFGGSLGIRDLGALESAIFRPHATFGGIDLYDTPAKKAAAILESIVKNHPFIDGNKRTGYVLMRLLIMDNGLDIDAS